MVDPKASKAIPAPDPMADLVEIDVLRPISFAGVRVAPQIEKGTGKIFGPRRAYVPRVVAEGHPASRVVIVGPAPAGAKVGQKAE